MGGGVRELPEGWAEVALADVWRESRARVPPETIPSTRYIGLEHVESGTSRITGEGTTEDVKSTVAVFSSGDVLYGRLRPYLNKVIRPAFGGAASTEFLVFNEGDAVSNQFLLRLLSSSDLVSHANAASAGVNLPRVSAKNLGEYRLGLPSPSEQRRIVARIEALFVKLDNGVAALKRVDASLERYRASVLKAAVEGRLTERWRRGNPPDETGEELLRRILAERRRRWEAEQLAAFAAKGRKPPRNWKSRYKEPVAPDMARLPELPEGWYWASVDQVAELVQYGSSSKTSQQADVPVLRMGNIQGGELEVRSLKYLPADHREFPALLLRDGDLLFNRTNSAALVGKSAVYHGQVNPCSFASYLIRVRLIEGCVPDLLAACLNSPFGRRWAAAVVSQQVGQANISGRKLRAFAFPLPPVLEQTRVVAAISRSLSGGRRGKRAAQSALCAAAALRQSILKRAFEGGLVPQDPDDEPAAGLLERIRAAREA